MTRTMTQNAHESCECTASFYVLAKRTLENTLIIAACRSAYLEALSVFSHVCFNAAKDAWI